MEHSTAMLLRKRGRGKSSGREHTRRAFTNPDAALLRQFRSSVLFCGFDESLLQAIEQELEWVSLRTGDTLFEQGDPGDSLYVLICGRLDVMVRARGQPEEVIGEISQGEPVGEMAVLTGEPRSGTVRAARDALLARLPSVRFRELTTRHPAILSALSQLLIQRLRTRSSSRPAHGVAKSFAVLPVGSDVPVRQLAQDLATSLADYGTVLHLNQERFESIRGPGASLAAVSGSRHGQLVNWFIEQESRHDFIVLEADSRRGPWAQRCVRHSDALLLVANAADRADSSEIDKLVSRELRGATTRRRALLLLHRPGIRLPSDTRKWLDAVAVDDHHHLRLGVRGDIERLTRFLAGRAVALALAGGAARGYAHIGVIRALEEARIPIDLVCGTSMGSLVGALYALGLDHQEMHRKLYSEVVENTIFDYTLPVISALAGNRLDEISHSLFGDAHIEDLWHHYFCVSSNLTRAEQAIHRRGLVRRAVRASSSVPGLLPPVVLGGDLHVDGALLNNLPADVARQTMRGHTIAVNVIPTVDPTMCGASEGRSPLAALVDRLNPLHKQRHPLISDIVMRGVFVNAVSMAGRLRQEVDLFIEPPVDQFSFFDAKRLDAIADVGYQEARCRIEEATRRGLEFPRQTDRASVVGGGPTVMSGLRGVGQPDFDFIQRRWIPLCNAMEKYHRFEIRGVENFPRSGRVLVVGHHALATYYIAPPISRTYQETGRWVRVLADRFCFQIPFFGAMVEKLGWVDASPATARALLENEEVVAIPPGGMWEALRPSSQRFKLRWEGHKGFARLALDTHAPVILATCPAADLIFTVYANPLTDFVYRQFRLPLPLARGVGPSLIPRPVKLTFHYSKPIPPPQPAGAEPTDQEIVQFRDLLERRMNALTAAAVKADGLEHWVVRDR